MIVQGHAGYERDQALSLWSRSTVARTLDYQRTTLRSIKYWELTQRKPLWCKIQHQPTTNSTLCRTPHLNSKQNKNANPIIRRQDYHLTQSCPSEEKQTNKNSAPTSPYKFSSVQLPSRVRLFETPWIAARQASLSITNSRSSPKPMYIESMMPSRHLILCCPLLLLLTIPHSIRVFSNESMLHIRLPKYCSFSLSISSSNEYPGLVSFRMDWLDILAVQGTFKRLL